MQARLRMDSHLAFSAMTAFKNQNKNLQYDLNFYCKLLSRQILSILSLKFF